MTTASEALHRRVREIRSRAAIRQWEMRQLDRASGAWFRVARVLTYARAAWAIDEADAEALVGSGHEPHPAGLELQPARRLFVVTAEEIADLPSARALRLTASPELLAYDTLALVPFSGLSPDPTPPIARAQR